MTESKAKTITIAAVGAAGVLSSLEHVAQGNRPPLRTFVGVVVSGVILLTVAEVAPDVAGGLALLLLTGAVLRNGAGAARTLSDSLD